jgi:hypothetical protein
MFLFPQYSSHFTFLYGKLVKEISDFDFNHIEGKITQIWLANEEGIFS